MHKAQKSKEVVLTGAEVVIQDNSLIESPKNLDLQEQKLFLFLVSKIDPYDPQQQVSFRITVKDFAKAIGLNNPRSLNTAYRDVRKVMRALQRRIVTEIEQGRKGKIITDMPLITYAKYYTGEGYADIELNPHLTPLLFKLRREFTQYKLSNIINLSSVYAIRLYELLKKQEVIGQRTFELEDLKEKLGVPKNALKQFVHFKSRVLEVAQREIKKTDIEIDYEFKKTGRKITYIVFNIKSKNPHREENKKLYIEHPSDRETEALVGQVIEFGFDQKEAQTVIGDAELIHVEEAIKAVKKQVEKGNAKNPKAMLRTAIKEKWTSAQDNTSRKAGKTTKNTAAVQPPTKKRHRSGFSKLFSVFFRRK